MGTVTIKGKEFNIAEEKDEALILCIQELMEEIQTWAGTRNSYND